MRLLPLVLTAATLLVSRALAQATVRLTPQEVVRWREDLAAARKEMPLRHANLYHAITPLQFDSAVTAIDSALPRLARHQVIVELMRLTALLGDGHSNVGPWRDTATAFHELPVSLYWFEDGMFVRAATTAYASMVGAPLLAIGGVPIQEAIARVRPLISSDNEMGVRDRTPLFLTMPEILHAVGLTADPTRIVLSVGTATGPRNVTVSPVGLFPMQRGETDLTWQPRDGWVDARDKAPTPLWLSEPTNLYWARYLPATGTFYWQLNAIQQKATDSLKPFMDRMLHTADSLGAERLVLDLRLNGGGNGHWHQDILRGIIKSRYDAPGRFVVITGRRTFSAAQMLISRLEEYTEAIFVGEPSASRGNHYGDSFRITLPNSHVTVRVSSLYWQYWDSRDKRPWIPVTPAAPLRFADYATGRDPALEAAQAIVPRP